MTDLLASVSFSFAETDETLSHDSAISQKRSTFSKSDDALSLFLENKFPAGVSSQTC